MGKLIDYDACGHAVWYACQAVERAIDARMRVDGECSEYAALTFARRFAERGAMAHHAEIEGHALAYLNRESAAWGSAVLSAGALMLGR